MEESFCFATPSKAGGNNSAEVLAADTEDVSPHRACLRRAAFTAVKCQEIRMQKRVAQAQGKLVLEVGDMVRVGVTDVERGRTDPSSMVLVIVEVVAFTSEEVCWKYRVACPRGVMNALYARPYLIPTRSALDPTQLGFTNTLAHWKSMPVIGERKAVCFASATGGQGLLRCSCKGSCLVGRCACRKAGRVCNSRCHKRSCRCENHDC